MSTEKYVLLWVRIPLKEHSTKGEIPTNTLKSRTLKKHEMASPTVDYHGSVNIPPETNIFLFFN